MAIRLGAELLDGSGAGVWFVDLAPLLESALVAGTVAGVLGVSQQPGVRLLDALADALVDRRLLLVLDNCQSSTTTCARRRRNAYATPTRSRGCAWPRRWGRSGAPGVTRSRARALRALRAQLEHADARQPIVLRGYALVEASDLLACILGDYHAAMTCAEEALAIADRLHDECLAAHALRWRAWVELREGDLRGALADNDHAITIARSLGDHHLLAYLAATRGAALSGLGQDARPAPGGIARSRAADRQPVPDRDRARQPRLP